MESEPYRRLERENLVRLMNLFVTEVLASGRFDLNLGTYRMEERLANSPESVPDSHLRAYRICRRSAMIIWTKELIQAIALLLGTRTRYSKGSWSKDRPLWAQILQEDWDQIRQMVPVIRDHKIWAERVNPEVVSAIALTRQKDWEQILLKGRLPGCPDSFSLHSTRTLFLKPHNLDALLPFDNIGNLVKPRTARVPFSNKRRSREPNEPCSRRSSGALPTRRFVHRELTAWEGGTFTDPKTCALHQQVACVELLRTFRTCPSQEANDLQYENPP